MKYKTICECIKNLLKETVFFFKQNVMNFRKMNLKFSVLSYYKPFYLPF